MKALVTGASGFLGTHLVTRLLKDNYQVIAFGRSPIGDKYPKNINSHSTPIIDSIGDITQADSILQAIQKHSPNVVFHLAGHIGYKKAERPLMNQVNVEGTRNVVAAITLNPNTQLVHLSSVVAIGAGFKPTEVLNEESEYNLKDLDLGYFETKRIAEDIVKDAVKQGKIQAVILNPSTIYGAGDATKGSRKTQLKVARGQFPFYTSGGVSVVAVNDVIEGIIAASRKGKNGERYILSGENITIQDLFARIARTAGVEAPRWRLPNWLLHTLGISGDLMTQMGLKAGISRENAHTATLYHWFDNSKSKRELGLNYSSADMAIKESVNWMKEHDLL